MIIAAFADAFIFSLLLIRHAATISLRAQFIFRHILCRVYVFAFSTAFRFRHYWLADFSPILFAAAMPRRSFFACWRLFSLIEALFSKHLIVEAFATTAAMLAALYDFARRAALLPRAPARSY